MSHQVELINASKIYGDFVAIESVDLAVEKGEFFSILGPSGGGKTTILRAVAGLLDLTRGALKIAGTPMEGVPVYKRNVGIVFQNYALFPHMNVLENVAFGLRMRKLPQDEARRAALGALDRVQLSQFAQRMPSQLSGGQQQRVALARAIVVNPQVLLLDEPLGALDRNLRIDMQAELRQLQRNLGLTTICVTHDQEEALTLSDRIAIMSKGRVEQIGSPADIYETPVSRFVAEFVGGANFLDATVTGADGEALLLDWRGQALRVSTPRRFLAGSPVAVCLRHERVRLVDPGTAGAIAGVVDNVSYRGGDHIAHVRSESGFAFVLRGEGKPRVTLGEAVGLNWAADAPQVLPA